MSPLLAVRNLTSDRIFIKHIEQYEDPNSLQSNTRGTMWGLRSEKMTSSDQWLNEVSKTFQHQDLDINLGPFDSCVLDHLPPETIINKRVLSTTVHRLTLEGTDGRRYRIDFNPSNTQKSTQSLTSLSSSLATYHAIFHPSKPTCHLTIHSNNQINYGTWMSTLSEALSLSALSIPGTHNSHTHYRAVPSARCQVHDIKTQLEQGIRFLDVRVQPAHATDLTRKELLLVHGSFPISLTGPKLFAPILKTCYDFLASNPSETLLMSLKREGIGNATDHHLANILEEHYINPNPEKWYVATDVPLLGKARGKIILIRRYHANRQLGLDATPWPHSTTHARFPAPQATFCLQDFCDVLTPTLIPDKMRAANEHLVRAAACTHTVSTSLETAGQVQGGAEPLHLNFLSASNFWNRACWPEKIAKVMNRGIEEWLCSGHHLAVPVSIPSEPETVDGGGRSVVTGAGVGDGGTGVVIMDCVGEGGDWDLVRLVVGMNMGVLMRMRNEV